MTPSEFDTHEADDDLQTRGLLKQAAITAVMILLGLKITVDVVRRRWSR